MCFFFFKQKTAYEMRISDWSSDVCASDLGLKTILSTFSRVRAGSAGTVAAVRLDEPRRLRSLVERGAASAGSATPSAASAVIMASARSSIVALGAQTPSGAAQDRKSTRLNSSH